MLKDFDGHTFQSHGIVPSLLVELVGKTTLIEVEVFDVLIDYNILLGCSWTYVMVFVVSSIYRVVKFP